MRSRCEALQEAIWDHVRFGTELSGDEREHVEHCAECARELAQAKRMSETLIKADCVPSAPDCRRAVMARISPAPKQPRMVWAYACAGLALASVAVGGVMYLSPSAGPGVQLITASAPETPPNHDAAEVMPVVPQPKDAIPEVHSNTGMSYARSSAKRYARHAEIKQSKRVLVAKAITAPYDGRFTFSTSASRPITVVNGNIVGDVKRSIESSVNYSQLDATKTIGRLDEESARISIEIKTPAGDLPVYALSTPVAGSNAATADRFTAAKPAPSAPDLLTASKEMSDYGFALNGAIKADGARSVMSYDMSTTKDRIALQPAGDALKLSSVYANSTAGDKWKSAADDARPVAIAVVDWSAPTRPLNYSYSYTDTDPHTGRTTNCSVERSGGVVNIRLEAEPEEKRPSERGSINYDDNTNV